jgi:flagellar basal-body rod protein FlgG
MNRSLIGATTTMQSIQQKMDVISNNLSNLNTVGYKRRGATFQDVLTSVYQQTQPFNKEGRMTPLGFPQGMGAKLGAIELSLEQGVLQNTNLPSDVAIDGTGLFEIERNTLDNEGNPQIAWTRDGSFQLVPDRNDPNQLILMTKMGDIVRSATDEPIRIPPNHAFTIDERGRVLAKDKAQSDAQPIQVGQLKLVRPIRPQMLSSIGNNLFGLPQGLAVDGILENMDLAADNENGRIAIRQGYLEGSNVNIAEEMVELVNAQRAYSLNSRVLSSSDTLMDLTNNLRT